MAVVHSNVGRNFYSSDQLLLHENGSIFVLVIDSKGVLSLRKSVDSGASFSEVVAKINVNDVDILSKVSAVLKGDMIYGLAVTSDAGSAKIQTAFSINTNNNSVNTRRSIHSDSGYVSQSILKEHNGIIYTAFFVSGSIYYAETPIKDFPENYSSVVIPNNGTMGSYEQLLGLEIANNYVYITFPRGTTSAELAYIRKKVTDASFPAYKILYGVGIESSAVRVCRKGSTEMLCHAYSINGTLSVKFSTDGGYTFPVSLNPVVTGGKVYDIHITSGAKGKVFVTYAYYTASNTPPHKMRLLVYDGVNTTTSDLSTSSNYIYSNIASRDDIAITRLPMVEQVGTSIVYSGDFYTPSITPKSKGLGSISSPTSLLTYSIKGPSGSGESTVIERINGVVIATKKVVDGGSYSVSVPKEQWLNTKFGKYSSAQGVENAITLEWVELKSTYTYPFVKTLPNESKTSDVLLAVDDMVNVAMPSHKKRLVDAIGDKATVGGTG